jgi:beta-N-acetylhexosaminidase
MVLLPSDLEGAFSGLLDAVHSGVISMQAIDHRVLKVLRAKAAVNLHRGRLVDIEQIATRVGRPEDMSLAQEIADAAVTLVRNDSPVLNLLAEEKRRKPGTSAAQPAYETAADGGVSGTLALVFTDNVRADWGTVLQRELKARVPDAKVIFIDPSLAAAVSDSVMSSVQSAKVVIMALYSIPSGGKLVRTAQGQQNSVSLSLDSSALADRILKAASDKVAVVALGNPYLAAEYPDTKTYLCTFSHMPTSEAAAIKALFGEIPIRGRTPVTIPGLAARGAGIERGAVARRNVKINSSVHGPGR